MSNRSDSVPVYTMDLKIDIDLAHLTAKAELRYIKDLKHKS